jgi:hypothetical protein
MDPVAFEMHLVAVVDPGKLQPIPMIGTMHPWDLSSRRRDRKTQDQRVCYCGSSCPRDLWNFTSSSGHERGH